jgi:signal transduction histidine kinase
MLALLVGTLVQFVLAVAVLRPLELRESRSRAELTASSLATEIAAHTTGWSPTEYRSMVERHRVMLGPGRAVFGYRDGVGWRFTDPPDRADFLDRVQSLGLPPREDEPRPRGGEPPPRELIVRHPVMRGAERLGEVVVVRPLRQRGRPTSGGSVTALLFVPIALIPVLLGLMMVRVLVRRLRSMETLAARVAEGDLSARIGDTSGDEIGRVAARLDWMTGRLAEARTRVEAAEQQRRQLFADITHELATPLTSIRGYAETLLDPAVSVSDDERGHYLRGVLEESRRLDRLIRDLFELARLEAGASALTIEPLDWTALCRNTVTRFEPRFREAGLRLLWREPAEQAWVEADGHRLEQVLENLLANALRYVPSGGTIELALTRAPGGAGAFCLTVSDDGPGLPPQDLAHAFERFYRAAGARGTGAARDAGGSGLGLAIVREIVERHGGTVRAETREPHGLAIIIELPARA